jgi:hypothetical protein
MFVHPRFSLLQAVYGVLIVAQVTCVVSAQNFTARSANLNPFGVNGPLPFGQMSDFGGGKGLKGGFATGIGLSSAYNSNILLSKDDPESDITFSLSPTLNYTTDPEGSARMALSATYAPTGNVSLSNSEYSSFDQSGSVSMIISGSRTTISAFAGISQDSGVDSLAVSEGFLTGTAVSLGIQMGYQLAPRTSISAGLSSSITDYGDGSAVDFNGYSLNLGGSWAATERLNFGPSLSYSTSSSDNSNTGDIDTWGASIVASYKVSEKIQVSGSIGAQFSNYSQEGGSGDFSPTVSLNANYQIDELWSWNGSIHPGIIPSPTQASYSINAWSISSGLNRSLLIGSLGMGVDMQFSYYESIGPVSTSQDGENNIGVFMSYGHPFFSDRIGFSSSIRYVRSFGESEWSQIQLNAGLNMTF